MGRDDQGAFWETAACHYYKMQKGPVLPSKDACRLSHDSAGGAAACYKGDPMSAGGAKIRIPQPERLAVFSAVAVMLFTWSTRSMSSGCPRTGRYRAPLRVSPPSATSALRCFQARWSFVQPEFYSLFSVC